MSQGLSRLSKFVSETHFSIAMLMLYFECLIPPWLCELWRYHICLTLTLSLCCAGEAVEGSVPASTSSASSVAPSLPPATTRRTLTTQLTEKRKPPSSARTQCRQCLRNQSSSVYMLCSAFTGAKIRATDYTCSVVLSLLQKPEQHRVAAL